VNKVQRGGVAATVIAAAVALAVPITSGFEGLRTKPYRDPAGIPTVCYGETAVPMQDYSAAECVEMLAKRQTKDFAPLVVRAVPALGEPDHVQQLAASLDFAYNVGTFTNTSMARLFRDGRWAEGCDAFTLYTKAHVHGKLTVLPGLVIRRQCEKAMCLGDVASFRQYCPADAVMRII